VMGGSGSNLSFKNNDFDLVFPSDRNLQDITFHHMTKDVR